MGAGLRIRSKDGGLALIESSIFEEEGFIAAFTTRMGGWSPRPFDGLNMGFGVPDDPANVRMNRPRPLRPWAWTLRPPPPCGKCTGTGS